MSCHISTMHDYGIRFQTEYCCDVIVKHCTDFCLEGCIKNRIKNHVHCNRPMMKNDYEKCNGIIPLKGDHAYTNAKCTRCKYPIPGNNIVLNSFPSHKGYCLYIKDDNSILRTDTIRVVPSEEYYSFIEPQSTS